MIRFCQYGLPHSREFAFTLSKTMASEAAFSEGSTPVRDMALRNCHQGPAAGLFYPRQNLNLLSGGP